MNSNYRVAATRTSLLYNGRSRHFPTKHCPSAGSLPCPTPRTIRDVLRRLKFFYRTVKQSVFITIVQATFREAAAFIHEVKVILAMCRIKKTVSVTCLKNK